MLATHGSGRFGLLSPGPPSVFELAEKVRESYRDCIVEASSSRFL